MRITRIMMIGGRQHRYTASYNYFCQLESIDKAVDRSHIPQASYMYDVVL